MKKLSIVHLEEQHVCLSFPLNFSAFDKKNRNRFCRIFVPKGLSSHILPPKNNMSPENQWLVQMYFLLKSSLFRGTNSFVSRGATPRIPVSSCNCLFRTPETTEVTPAQVKLLVYHSLSHRFTVNFLFFFHISDCEILNQQY